MLVTEIEFAKIMFITILSMIIYSRFIRKGPLFEFFLYALPQFVAIKFIEKVNFFYIFFFVLLILIPKKYTKSFDVQPDLIDRSRMKVIFLVCTVFLLSTFEKQKLGVEEFGKVRLLDFVMESFVFNSGIVAFKATKIRKCFHILKSFCLGSFRLFLKLKSSDLRTDQTEYINVFFILCIINALSLFGLPRYAFFFGLFLLLTYQAALFLGLEQILVGSDQIVSIFSYFKGFAYVIPMYSLYLMSSDVGKSIILENSKLYFLFYITLALTFFFILRYFCLPSSLLHNAPFCLVVFIVNCSDLLIFNFCSEYFKICKLEITKFASRVVFHVFVTVNIFIPLARKNGFFESESDLIINAKVLFYLFVIFYGMSKIGNALIDKFLGKWLDGFIKKIRMRFNVK